MINEWIPVEQTVLDVINKLRPITQRLPIARHLNENGTLDGAFCKIVGAAIFVWERNRFLVEANGVLKGAGRVTERVEHLAECGFVRLDHARGFFREANVKNFTAWAAAYNVGIRWTGNGTVQASAFDDLNDLVASATVKIPVIERVPTLDEIFAEPVSEPAEAVGGGGGLRFW